MKHIIGEKILFNDKKYYVADVAIYKQIEYYFVFECDTGRGYKILYEEDGILHQVIKFDNYEKLLNLFKGNN